MLSDDITVYECSVLVTTLKLEALSVAQLYRDRADAENNFDELKNYWGREALLQIDSCRLRIQVGFNF